jgi:ATP-dependent exoDNAse (exonuclease V) alpha subunit
LGYALGSKEDAVQAREDFHSQMSEALSRDDGGADVPWSPASGQGRRPSSIYANGVTSLATADLEIEATASANPRVRESTMHMVFSLSPRVERTDEEFVGGVRETLDRLGLSGHQYVIAVHRDTDSIHAHVALCTVDPLTYRAMDRQWLWSRIDRAMRETEIERGWENDHGLVVVRDRGLSTERIENATKAELKMWRADREADRLARAEIKRDYLDDTFARKADATIAPRLRAAVEQLRERGENPDWGELHLVAARYGARIEREPATAEGLPSPIVLVDSTTGEPVNLHAVLRADIENEIGPYRTVQEAEHDFVAALERDPDLVARHIGGETSTFDRSDIVRYLDDRISDTGEIERLASLVETKADLRIVSADVHTPLYAYAPQAELEARLASHASAMAQAKDAGFDRGALAAAIASVEREIKSPLSDEQRNLVEHLDRGLCVGEGDPGTGKTVAMRVAKSYADRTGRDIVGLTISQAAARRLQDETGIVCHNTSKGLALEQLGEDVIKPGSIVVLDESGMNDARTAEALLQICRERNATAICVGDTKQLQPVLAGQSLRIIRREAAEAGTYSTLTGIQRQRNDWHRDSVKDLADGLRAVGITGSIDGTKVQRAIERLDAHGVFQKSDDVRKMIDAVARDYCVTAAIARSSKTHVADDVVFMAASKETQRYANEAIRERLGLTAKGADCSTRYGSREFAVGDTVVLRQNNTFRERFTDGKGRLRYRDGATVANGDLGEVVSARKDHVSVKLRNGKTISIDTRKYDAVDHGYVLTYHAAQGASVGRAVMILDRAASAELFFVGTSRSKESLTIHYSAGNFESVAEIAEHVAGRSSLKTTSQTFEEVLAKSAGKDALRKQAIAGVMASEDHPLRRKYEATEADKRQARATGLESLRKTYAERAAAIPADLSLSERLERAKAIEMEHRSAARQVVEQYKPVQFGRFVHDETVARDAAREIEQELEAQRQSVRDRLLQRSHDRADDRHEMEYEHER